MIDSYLFKSLFATIIIYLVFLSSLVTFVLFTGILGAFIIFIIIMALLIYFYGGCAKIAKFLDK